MKPGKVCDVHRWAYGITDPQEGVRWCRVCRAWICDECRDKWTVRGIAALKKGVHRTTDWLLPRPSPRDPRG